MSFKEPSLAKELILYNWVDYMPPSVMDAFEKEYGIKVRYVAYESQEEVVESIQSGCPVSEQGGQKGRIAKV